MVWSAMFSLAALLISAEGTAATPEPTVINATCHNAPADIALIIDNSGTIQTAAYKTMMEDIETLSLVFEMAPEKTRLAVVTFTDEVQVRFNLAKYNDNLDALAAMMKMERQNGSGANTADALKTLSDNVFKEENGARAGVPKLALVFSTGKSLDPKETQTQAAAARSLGYVLYVVGVGAETDAAALRGIAGQQNPERFCPQLTFDAMVDLSVKVVLKACESHSGSASIARMGSSSVLFCSLLAVYLLLAKRV